MDPFLKLSEYSPWWIVWPWFSGSHYLGSWCRKQLQGSLLGRARRCPVCSHGARSEESCSAPGRCWELGLRQSLWEQRGLSIFMLSLKLKPGIGESGEGNKVTAFILPAVGLRAGSSRSKSRQDPKLHLPHTPVVFLWPTWEAGIVGKENRCWWVSGKGKEQWLRMLLLPLKPFYPAHQSYQGSKA